MKNENKIIKQIPQSEDGARVRCNFNNHIYLLTWNKTKNKHTLWLVCSNGYEKLTTKNSPLELYDVIEKLENKI